MSRRAVRPVLKRGSRRTVDVAAGLVFRDGKLLITRRRPEDHLGGLWEFPGGKRESSETFEECLTRELNEELGIRVAVRELVDSVTHSYPQQRVRIRFYFCRWLEHEPITLGCQDLRWVGPEELTRYSFPNADARVLSKL